MSPPKNEDLAGERYYNKTSLIIYSIVIAIVIYDIEPNISFMKLLIGTAFVALWTFVAGVAIYFLIKPIIGIILSESKLDEMTTTYGIWIIPSIGFSLFLFISYN